MILIARCKNGTVVSHVGSQDMTGITKDRSGISLIFAAIAIFGFSHPANGQPTNTHPASHIIADLRHNSLSAEDILHEDGITDMAIVSLKGFAGARLQELQETLKHTEDNFAEVRTAIGRNEAWAAKLEQTGTALNDVRAVTRDDAGRVTVYVEMPMP